MRAFTDWLIRVAGPDPADLRDNELERTRYTVMGMAVCITAMFATGAVPAALSLATGRFRPIFLLFGALWGLFVFNLDRWVVSTTDYKSLRLDQRVTWTENVTFWFRRVALLVIRLAIAVLIGLSISEPIIMLVYGTEIDVQISKDQAAERARAAVLVNRDPQYAIQLASFAQVLTQATTTRKQDETAVNNANSALDAEEAGHGGTFLVGLGPRSAERRADLNNANKVLASANAAFATARRAYDHELTEISHEKAAELKLRDKAIDATPGLLDRETALSELAHEYPTVNDARWVLRGLILLMDVAPVLLKVASPVTAYDRIVRTRSIRQVAAAEGLLQADVTADLEVAAHSRTHRVRYEKLAAHEKYRIADEQMRRDADLQMRVLVDGHSRQTTDRQLRTIDDVGLLDPDASRASSRPGTTSADSDTAGSSGPGYQQDTWEDDAPADKKHGKSASSWGSEDRWVGSRAELGQNILGMPGNGIEQYVGGRWKIGAQLPNADPALAWRTPYLAQDMLGFFPGVAALKKVHPANKARGIIEALQEVISLPHGREISPHVAPIIQGGIDREFGWYVVTPYYKNGTLQRRMAQDPPLNLGIALSIIEQTLQGLLAAFTFEDKFLLHFDIKPSNIAFDDDGKVRIIDWGLSEVLNPDYRLTISGSPRYTMWYAPPEQVLASPEVTSNWHSPACDIRAVGAVLYAIVTGQPPLHLEARWAGMLDDAGNLKQSSEDEFKRLLATTSPMRLEEFFAASQGWDPSGLRELSDLVAAWLHPSPFARTPADWAGPAQQAAADALQKVVRDMRAGYPGVLAQEIGVSRLGAPAQRSRDLVPMGLAGQRLHPSDSTTVGQAETRSADSGQKAQIGAQP